MSNIWTFYGYYFLHKKENVLGFLDNNVQRHGKKLYGTDKIVFNPLTIDFRIATVLLCDCPYKEEIYNGLKKIYEHIRIMYI
jgi:hypothetical protein